ncbi:bud emergence protein 1 [Rhizophlyctis rosea]|nr:bud emergence protein 1 [Rhizophlyctis rosea]
MLQNLFSSPTRPNKSTPPPRGGGPGGATGPPRSSSHSDAIFNLPPKKVVRSMMDYTAQFAQELSFKKGDFFYVINEDSTSYYEVINPIARVRGLVPISCFENLDKVVAKANANNADYGDDSRPRTYGHPTLHSQSSDDSQDGGYDDSRDYTRSAPPQPRTAPYIAPRGVSQHRRRPSTEGTHPHHHLSPPSAINPHISHGPTSPTSPTGINQIPPRIIQAIVQNVEMRSDNQWHFTIEIKRDDDSRSVIFRVYDDFWACHVALLNHFPSHSGRSQSQPRIIPFLQPPTRDVTPALAQQRRTALDIYLNELLSLPHPISDSFILTRFFMPRKGDIETPTSVVFDPSTTLMDLISDYKDQDHSSVKIKLSLGEEMVAWKVDDGISYVELLEEVEDKIGAQVEGLAYKDEIGELIELKGNRDLGLLIRTNPQKLIFYVR